MIKNWKRSLFIFVFAGYCFYLVYSIYSTCSESGDCFSKPIWPGIVAIVYAVVGTSLYLFLNKISSRKTKNKKTRIEKLYKFFIWLLAISLVELFSAYFLEITKQQNLGSGNGIISLAARIPLVQLFGVKFADSITSVIHNILNLWYMWGVLVWYLRRRLKTIRS